MHRRHLLRGAAALPLLPALARAQAAWPDRPVRLIVPYPPGGGTDVISREVGNRLTAAMGWTVVVENRPGAGGNIGIDVVAKATDGHTIGMGQTSNLAINPTLYAANIPYQPLRDLALVSLVAVQPNVLVVAKGARFRSLADVIAAAKEKPGALTAGHPGSGTVGHLSSEMIAQRAGVELTIVPYRGAAQLTNDLLAGRVDLYSANPLAVRGMLESGDLRALAVTSAERMPSLPQVPTVAESGFPGFEAVNWTGLVGPAQMPAEVVAKVNAAMRRVLTDPAVIERLAAEGATPRPSTPEEFRTFLAAEIEKWGKVVREGNVQVG
ncbi:tripartite tricarboxylate transporter substrate binding protein [Roseomonas sp. OT10]|uniref:Bug family tripartite tricarboxylate transporter substrate binding protein n=1 Tax=Roseomonas cutis TaxID=2897332 RepID=UPI001E4A357D|nr:tripartite tricarboxylate transporter substrate binding protein [Roseomonas sp. OT10]UFN48979.1 tripartite tricarboxylate transporter substrate binding protein [Roseomonas sp. OT10]